MKLPPAATVLLLLAAFAAPLMGGQISLEANVMQGSWLAAMFDPMNFPFLAHMFVALLTFAAAFTLLFQRRVIQVPNNRFSGTLIAFVSLLFATALFSHYQHLALAISAEWFVYALAALTAVATLGRTRGPVACVGAIFLATALLARNGILEHFEMVKTDPSWRIFAGWGPNSLAGILVIGLFLGLGLMLSQRRAIAAVVGVLTLAIAYALFLTQSRGGILIAVPLGLVFLVTMILCGKVRPNLLPWVGRAAILAILAVNVGVIVRTKMPTVSNQAIVTEASSGAANVLTRIKGSSGDEQSVGFRKMLYVTSMRLVQANPLGYGAGSFRHVSARPGIGTLTVLGHNTLLQLAVEASPLCPILLALLLFWWMEGAMKSFATIPWRTNILRLSIVVAVLATFFHGSIESNLYTFGLGFTTFLLLGIGLQLSADAVSPEFAPPPAKAIGAIAMLLAAMQVGLNAVGEVLHDNVKTAVTANDLQLATASVGQLQSFAGNDGETWYLSASFAPSSQDRISNLRRATELTPIPKYFRAYASALALDSQVSAAISALDEALIEDPNNLPAWLAKLKLQVSQGDVAAATKTGDALLAIENNLYFRTRSLPDLIPTETYEGREILATLTTDKAKQASLLQEAVNGFAEYRKLTWPSVISSSIDPNTGKGDPNKGLGGETLRVAIQKLTGAREDALKLAALYRELGKPGEAGAADAAAADFAAALASAAK